MLGFIYKIVSPTNRVYIGQTINIERRFKEYRYLKTKSQPKLNKSLLKYGVENHIFQVIEQCEISELNNRERYWQDYYNVTSKKGLNSMLTKSDSASGNLTYEHKSKISKSNLGKKFSFEHKLKLSEKRKGKYKGVNNVNYKPILNLETGIYYDTSEEASNTIGISRTLLTRYLNGNRRNKTSFIYA